MEPKRSSTLKLSLQRAGTGVEAPGQQSLSNREIRPITISGCWHADARDLGVSIFFLQAATGMKSNITLQVTTRREIVIIPMGWKQGEVELHDKQNKQFDPGA